MITRAELQTLLEPSTRDSIARNISRSTADIALDKRIAHAGIVASQVKYLQRAKSKLPSYYSAQCIIPSLAYEQSSSEATAALKSIGGESLLELTCGLGVDTYHLSKSFERVVTIERDEVLADVARENFRRLGAENITVIAASAEEYIAECAEQFDWIYADPARRGMRGEKLVRLEECSPDMVALKPRLEEIARCGVMIKCSPLFDVDEAFRLFAGADVEVVSSHDECKEVVIISQKDKTEEHIIVTTTEGLNEKFAISEIDNTPCRKPFEPQQYRWLVVPNVALQKSRTAVHALREEADMWSNNGFGLSQLKPTSKWGRVFEIEEVIPFQPKVLNRRFTGCGVEILKRDFALSTSALKFRAGSDNLLALTTIGRSHYAIVLKR